MNIEKTSAIISTTLAVIIGWVLSQLSQWYKNKKSENRTRKKVLFCMFEVHHIASTLTLNIEEILEYGIKKMHLRLAYPEGISDEEKKMFKDVLLPLIRQPIEQAIEKNLEIISDKFEEAVSSLSTVSPLLAFELAGSALPLKLKKEVYKPLEQYKVNLEIEENSTLKKSIKGFINDKVHGEILNFFQDYILRLARQIGIVTWYKAGILLKNKSALEDRKKEINELVDEYCSHILKIPIEKTPTKL